MAISILHDRICAPPNCIAAAQVSRSKLLILVLPIHAAAECSTALTIQRPVALIYVSLNVLARLFGYQVVQMDHNRIPV